MRDGSAEHSIVDWLDEKPAASATASRVAREILGHVKTRNKIVSDAIVFFDLSPAQSDSLEVIRKQIMERMNHPTDRDISLYRLAHTMLSNKEPLDGYFAEYLFQWARENQVSDEDTAGIFESSLAGYGYQPRGR